MRAIISIAILCIICISNDASCINYGMTKKDTLHKHWFPTVSLGFGSLSPLGLEKKEGLGFDREALVLTPQVEFSTRLNHPRKHHYFVASISYGRFKKFTNFTDFEYSSDTSILGGIIQRSGDCIFYLIGWGSNFYSIKNISLSADFAVGRTIFYNQQRIAYIFSSTLGPIDNSTLFILSANSNHFISRFRLSAQIKISTRLLIFFNSDLSYINRRDGGTLIELPVHHTLINGNSIGVTYKF